MTLVSPVMVYASDVQSFWQEPEVKFVSDMAVGKVALLLGCEKGRLTIALASVCQRVHAVDDHGGDSPYANTLQEFMKNLQRYRVMDRVVAHVGNMEKAILAFDKSVFHVAIISGVKALATMESNASLFYSMVATAKCALIIYVVDENEYKVAAAFSTKPGFQLKKLSERMYQVLYTRKGDV